MIPYRLPRVKYDSVFTAVVSRISDMATKDVPLDFPEPVSMRKDSPLLVSCSEV